MSPVTALVLLIFWLLSAGALLAICIAVIVSLLLLVQPDHELSFHELLVPLWCLLAGPEQREQLRAILARREARSRDGQRAPGAGQHVWHPPQAVWDEHTQRVREMIPGWTACTCPDCQRRYRHSHL